MPENDFLPFATAINANVITQVQYTDLLTRLVGFSPGIALSEELNKVWRQTAFVSAGVAQVVSDKLQVDVRDDGDLEAFVYNLQRAMAGFPDVGNDNILYARRNQDWTNLDSILANYATRQYVNDLLTGFETGDLGAFLAHYVLKAGDFMTGFLTLSGMPTAELHAASKGYVDSAILTALAGLPSFPDLSGFITQGALNSALAAYVRRAGDTMTGQLTLVGLPIANNHAASKAYVDQFLLRSGGTLTGYLVLHAAPTNDMHAANRRYVDDAIAGVSGPSGSFLPLSGGTMTGMITLPGTNATGNQAVRFNQMNAALANYLLLSGGTLTGGLGGTTGNFGGRLQGGELSTGGGWMMSANGNGDLVFGNTSYGTLATFNMNANSSSTPVDFSVGRNIWAGGQLAIGGQISGNTVVTNWFQSYGDANANRHLSNEAYIGGIHLWNNGRLRVEAGVDAADFVGTNYTAWNWVTSPNYMIGVAWVQSRGGYLWSIDAEDGIMEFHDHSGNVCAFHLQGQIGRCVLYGDGANGHLAYGPLFVTGAVYQNYCEDTHKLNVQPWTKGLAAIRALEPVEFDYDPDYEIPHTSPVHPAIHLPAGHQIAVMADAAAAVLPEMVSEPQPMAYEATETSRLLCPSVLVYTLVNACKELANQVDTLRTRLAALERRT